MSWVVKVTADVVGPSGVQALSCAKLTATGMALPVMSTADLRANTISAINADFAGKVVATPSDNAEGEIILTAVAVGSKGLLPIVGSPEENISFRDFALRNGPMSWDMGDGVSSDRFNDGMDGSAGTTEVFKRMWTDPTQHAQSEASSIAIATPENPFIGKVMVTVFALTFKV